MHLLCLEDDGEAAESPDDEAALLALRDELINLIQDASRPLGERLDALLDAVDFTIPNRDWAEVYRGLERLDPQWDGLLDQLDMTHPAALPFGLENALSQFAVYLLYRHLPGAMADDDVSGRVAFCVLSVRVLMALCAAKEHCTMADLIELARMYSAEIEYDEDNIMALLDALWEEE